MSEQEVMEYMQRYLDDDLTEDEYARLKEHLENDPHNSMLFERMKRLSDDLARLPKVTPPYSIVDSIIPKLEEMEPIQDERDRSQKRSNLFRSYKLWSAAAAVLLLAVIVFQNGLPFPATSGSTGSSGSVRTSGSASTASGDATLFSATSAEIGRAEKGDTSSASLKSELSGNVPSARGAGSEGNGNAGTNIASPAAPAPDQPVSSTPDSRRSQHDEVPNEKVEGLPPLIADADGGAEVADTGATGFSYEEQSGRYGFLYRETEDGEGGHETVVSAFPGSNEDEALASVSPDGSRTAYVYREGESVRVSITEAAETRYVSEPFYADEVELNWSEDGTTLVIVWT